MADKPSSPFAGLDKALLRSTQPSPAPLPASTDQERNPEAEGDVSTPKKKKTASAKPSKESYPPKNKGSVLAKDDDKEHDSMIASYHDDIIDVIRRTVKVPGREVSFVRLTPQEKDQLGDIVYTYKRQGKKTSENEINRIAVNFILQDYRTNGNNSILAKVIDALLA
jgi:hypothetical protein